MEIRLWKDIPQPKFLVFNRRWTRRQVTIKARAGKMISMAMPPFWRPLVGFAPVGGGIAGGDAAAMVRIVTAAPLPGELWTHTLREALCVIAGRSREAGTVVSSSGGQADVQPGRGGGMRHQQLYVSGRPHNETSAWLLQRHSSNNESASPAHTRDKRAVSKPVRHPGGTPNSQQRGLRRTRKEKTNSEDAAARDWQRRHTEVVVAARGGAYIATQTRLHS